MLQCILIMFNYYKIFFAILAIIYVKTREESMCNFIGVEILAANALIDLLEANKGRSITLKTLNKFGIEVVEYLEKNFNEKSVVLFDRERIGNLVLDYSDMFTLQEDTLTVNEGVSTERLRDRFRGPLTYEILKAIIDCDVTKIEVA